MLNAKSSKQASIVFFLASLAGLLFYVCGCYFVFQNSLSTEEIEAGQVGPNIVTEGLHTPFLHDGNFFRLLAERLQFYSHKPDDIQRFYSIALRKSPADHRITLSYARYLSSRSGYEKKSLDGYKETLRRFPTAPDVYVAISSQLIKTGDSESYRSYLRRAIELDGRYAPAAYAVVSQNQRRSSILLEITPQTDTGLLALAKYLAGERPVQRTELLEVLQRLRARPLSIEQRLVLAGAAIKAGDLQLAEEQAIKASTAEKSKIKALQILATVAREKKDSAKFEKIANEINKFQGKTGNKNISARYALEAAMLNPSKDVKTLMKVVEQYPDYAPAHFQIAILSKNTSPELAVNHMKRAVQLAPEQVEYKKQLLELYIRLSKFSEAEKIGESLVLNPRTEKIGYVLLARAKSAEGDLVQAAHFLEQDIEKNGDSKELLLQLGRTYESMREYRKAADVYLKYAGLNQNHAWVEGHNLAGDAYRRAGDLAAAREQYKMVLARKPNNEHARKSLSASH